MPDSSSFTSRGRRRTTKWVVRVNDRLARIVIAVGGIGTIVSVSLVAVFLVWVVVPLFFPATVNHPNSLPDGAGDNLLALGIDEYNVTGWRIFKGGSVDVFRLDNGEVIQRLSPEESGIAGATAV